VTVAALALAFELLARAAAPPAPAPVGATGAGPAGMQTGVPVLAKPDLSVRPMGPAAHGGETRCVLCHVADDWKRVTFSHDRTGFPLTGRHRDVTCAACHPNSDFKLPVARACAACHRDVHAQRLGQRCDRCHDTGTFKQASFGPGDHRKTAFPLDGRHAAIPCEECHGDRRDRSFSRPVVKCVSCHQKDYDRTTVDPRLLNHVTAGFPTDCRSCHSAWRFYPGAFAAHDACFNIRTGPHSGRGCRDCHTSGPLPAYVAGQPMLCASNPAPPVMPADCMHCHGDPKARHSNVAGYLASNPRCYECHRITLGTARRLGGGP
jgi:hypothetical protein